MNDCLRPLTVVSSYKYLFPTYRNGFSNRAPATRLTAHPKCVKLPASGKSTILKQLRKDLSFSGYIFFEGSVELGNLVSGGLDAFKQMDDTAKDKIRREAIEKIKQECIDEGKSGIVAGHFSFWNRDEKKHTPVWNSSDADVFTHIVYLHIDGETLAQQTQSDHRRADRLVLQIRDFQEWQKNEEEQLRAVCGSDINPIKFWRVRGGQEWTLDEICNVLKDVDNDEASNLVRVQEAMKLILKSQPDGLDAVLLIDGDKTLAPEDTGELFWNLAKPEDKYPLEALFSGYGYSHNAFRQAAILYEQSGDEESFEKLCKKVAAQVHVYPEFKNHVLTPFAASSSSVKVIVLTSGLRSIWEKVLQSIIDPYKATVIGSGRKKDYVVTPEVKESVAKMIQEQGYYVWAFGDSPLDLPMLEQADQAVVVVGDEKTRSKSMEEALQVAIDKRGLQVRQIVFPTTASPRLNTEKVPLVELSSSGALEAISVAGNSSRLRFISEEATHKPAAKLLMTATRDAAYQGPQLREAHHLVGRYLATEYLPRHLGLQQYQTKHVQSDKVAAGYRLFHEDKTLIVPLMRGGEPMAIGVSDAFPLAPKVHAKKPEDLERKHLKGMTNVILVDAVINSGASIIEFAKHIRKLRPTVTLVAVSGVTQEEAVKTLEEKIPGGFILISLRTSANKFTGQGGTDTGARLFNTTKMEGE